MTLLREQSEDVKFMLRKDIDNIKLSSFKKRSSCKTGDNRLSVKVGDNRLSNGRFAPGNTVTIKRLILDL